MPNGCNSQGEYPELWRNLEFPVLCSGLSVSPFVGLSVNEKLNYRDAEAPRDRAGKTQISMAPPVCQSACSWRKIEGSFKPAQSDIDNRDSQRYCPH